MGGNYSYILSWAKDCICLPFCKTSFLIQIHFCSFQLFWPLKKAQNQPTTKPLCHTIVMSSRSSSLWWSHYWDPEQHRELCWWYLEPFSCWELCRNQRRWWPCDSFLCLLWKGCVDHLRFIWLDTLWHSHFACLGRWPTVITRSCWITITSYVHGRAQQIDSQSSRDLTADDYRISKGIQAIADCSSWTFKVGWGCLYLLAFADLCVVWITSAGSCSDHSCAVGLVTAVWQRLLRAS